MSTIEFLYSVDLPVPASQVWSALVQPEQVAQYHFVPLLKLETFPGGEIAYGMGDDVMISGKITRFEPSAVLAHTFNFAPGEHSALAEADPETLVTYTLDSPPSGGTRLTLVHSGFPYQNQTYANIEGGWPAILDGLRRYLGGG